MVTTMKRGEVYYVYFKDAYGSEQGGTRPACIVQNDIGNAHSPTTIICPLTTKCKPMLPTHVQINKGLPEPSKILCEQIRVVDKGRIVNGCIYKLNSGELKELNKALKISIGII